MKFTLSWLHDHLDTSATLDDILAVLTTIGLEVEDVTDNSAALAPFIVAEITDAKPHPDADKLQVCSVNAGSQTLQIVCGAPNARAGLKVVLAPVGTTIPTNGMVIKDAKIRGVASSGMLCSESELGLGESHDGIMELPNDLNIGKPFAPQLKLDDPVIEIAITPDRGDCLGVRGIARDLAAAGLGALKTLDSIAVQATTDSPVSVTIKDDNNSCAMFVGRYFKGVSNGPSPDWLQQRLKAIGLRPISRLVDVTNYITMDVGRPLHVYDADKIGGQIIVHTSKGGETIDALNDKQYTLLPGMTVIDDAHGNLGIGGIVGGTPNSCTDDTTNMFLEVAWFDPIAIATTGRALQVESDARYRFERTVDPAFLIEGAEIATRMFQELCGGEVSELVIAGAEPDWQRTLSFRPARIAELGGVTLSTERMAALLEVLGFTIDDADADNWQVCVPSWRPDVEGEAHLVEEVVRIYGYEHIPTTPLPRPERMPDVTLPRTQRQADTARHLLASRGFMEVKHWSFVHHDWAARFGGDAPELRLANPISSDLDTMRPSLLPHLLQATARNHSRGAATISLCEIGLTWQHASPTGQRMEIAGVRAGVTTPPHPQGDARATDLFDVKADAQAALEACGAPIENARISRDVPDYYHPGRSGAFMLGKTVLGVFGELHPALVKAMGIPARTCAFELYPQSIPMPKKVKVARPAYQVSDLPPVDRDFSFIIGQTVAVADVVRALSGADKTLIDRVTVISDYQGEREKASGTRALALRTRLQPTTHTLTEADIDTVSMAIITAAQKVDGVVLSEALNRYLSEKQA